MTRWIALSTVALMILLSPASAGGVAGAVVPGANGRIVFARCIPPFKCGSATVPTWEIVTADAGGAHEKVLAGPFTRDVFDDHLIANWSPDGSRIIFTADLGGGPKIWQVNADGTGLQALFSAPEGTGLDDGPAFTPDGAHIVFTRCCPEGFGYSLWMIDAAGGGLRDITTEPQVNGDGPADTTPQVSPDGRRVVFNRCFPDQPCVVATASLSTGNIRNVTDNTLFASEHPNWSPDSQRIVFQIHYFGGGADLAVVNPDGTGLRQLTFDGEGGRNGSFDPSFSPNGSRIIFSHFLSTGGTDLFTMDPNGGGVTQVTRTAALEFSAQWARRS